MKTVSLETERQKQKMKHRFVKSLLSLALLAGLSLTACDGGTTTSTSSDTTSSSEVSDSTDTSTESSTSSEESTSSSEDSTSSYENSESSSEAEEVVVTLTAEETTIKLDATLTLTATVTGAEDTSVTWATSDETIATVADGVVTAVGIGTADITATSVADTTKSATLTITIVDKYDVRISADGTYSVEAENLDLSGFVIRSDATSIKASASDCIESSDETTYGTSGGKSLGFIGSGTVLTVNFYMESAAKVTPMARMASVDSTFDVDGNIAFTVDSTAVDSNGYTSFGSADGNQYFNWKDVELTPMLLEAGAHTFTYTVTGGAINLDAFKLLVEDYDNTAKYYIVSADGTYTAEAEDVVLQDDATFVVRSDVAASKADAAACTEESDETTYGTSGGKSVGFIGAGTILTVNFYLGDDAVVQPIARMATSDATFDVDSNITFALDGTTVTSNGYSTFGSTTDNTYYNWQDVELTTTMLYKGFHTLTYTVTDGAIKLDAFKLVVSYYGNLAGYGYQITGNGTKTIEAENITLTSGSWVVEAPTGEAASITSGGYSIGNVAANTTFSINFNLGAKAYIDIVGVLAKYEDTYSLDGNFIATLDGETLTPGDYTFGHTDTNQYWNWQNVSLYSDILDAGLHTLTISAGTADNAFPNTDCFNITATAYGEDMDFYVADAETVRIEGEDVDQTNLISDGGSSFTESSTETEAATSGEECLCRMDKASYFEIPFYVNSDTLSVTITCRLSKYEEYNVSENYSCYLDGTKVEWTDTTITLGKTDGNDYHNWKLCPLATTALTTGSHTFKFSFDNYGANVDYIEFVFASTAA